MTKLSEVMTYISGGIMERQSRITEINIWTFYSERKSISSHLLSRSQHKKNTRKKRQRCGENEINEDSIDCG